MHVYGEIEINFILTPNFILVSASKYLNILFVYYKQNIDCQSLNLLTL